jgi:hypothetical protein
MEKSLQTYEVIEFIVIEKECFFAISFESMTAKEILIILNEDFDI